MKKLAYFFIFLIFVTFVTLLAVGDYVYREGTKLACSESITAKNNTPKEFYPNGKGKGPFRGDGWNKWVDADSYLFPHEYNTVDMIKKMISSKQKLNEYNVQSEYMTIKEKDYFFQG